MAQPVVFISRHRIKEGRLDDFRQLFIRNAPVMRSEKPGTVVFYAFTNDEGDEVKIVHLFPDAADMDAHLEGVAERSQEAMEFLEPQSFEILGTPGEEAMVIMRQAADRSGADLLVYPYPVGGYLNLAVR